MEAARADQRREAGLRTRARLLDAALERIAECGEDGVTLRELTDAAAAPANQFELGRLQSSDRPRRNPRRIDPQPESERAQDRELGSRIDAVQIR